MSKRKAAAANLGEDDDVPMQTRASKSKNKSKRFKPDKAPPCAFLDCGQCTAVDAVLLEINCNGSHHACASCIHREFQANLRFVPAGDGKEPAARSLRTHMTCPICAAKDLGTEIVPDGEAMKKPHPHHISLFDEGKEHVCGLCEFTGSLPDVYNHTISCIGWCIVCPECPKRLAPGCLDRHAAECTGQRINNELEKFAQNLSLWLLESGETSPTETLSAMQGIMELTQLLNGQLLGASPAQVGAIVSKLVNKLRSPNVIY